MTATIIANIKGPKGDPGDPGTPGGGGDTLDALIDTLDAIMRPSKYAAVLQVDPTKSTDQNSNLYSNIVDAVSRAADIQGSLGGQVGSRGSDLGFAFLSPIARVLIVAEPATYTLTSQLNITSFVDIVSASETDDVVLEFNGDGAFHPNGWNYFRRIRCHLLAGGGGTARYAMHLSGRGGQLFTRCSFISDNPDWAGPIGMDGNQGGARVFLGGTLQAQNTNHVINMHGNAAGPAQSLAFVGVSAPSCVLAYSTLVNGNGDSLYVVDCDVAGVHGDGGGLNVWTDETTNVTGDNGAVMHPGAPALPPNLVEGLSPYDRALFGDSLQGQSLVRKSDAPDVATSILAANRIYYVPITLGATYNATGIHLYVNSSSAGTAQAGIWDTNASGKPGTCLTAGNPASLANGDNLLSIGYRAQLTPGLYWMGVSISSASPSFLASLFASLYVGTYTEDGKTPTRGDDAVPAAFTGAVPAMALQTS